MHNGLKYSTVSNFKFLVGIRYNFRRVYPLFGGRGRSQNDHNLRN